MNLIPVSENDITIGKPLPWALYDSQHNLLLNKGSVVSDNNHRDKLLSRGACHELTLEASSNENGDSPFAARVNPAQLKVNESDTRYTFDDMKLKVEDRLQLQPPAQMARERFLVKVIGFLRGHSLLVTAPTTATGIRLQLIEGETIVMRSFSGQNAFGFACTIERICKLPYEYLHLSFPDVIEGIVIRTTPRVKTHITAEVQRSNSRNTEERGSAFITNISANGAALDARHPLGTEGDSIDLAFRVHLHNIDASLSIKGVIRAVFSCHATETSEPDLVRHGIEFQNMQPNDSVILESMIYQQLTENPHLMV